MVGEVASTIGCAAPPFELKWKTLRLLVDEIQLYATEGWVRIEGVIPRTDTHDEQIVITPVGRAFCNWTVILSSRLDRTKVGAEVVWGKIGPRNPSTALYVEPS